MECVHALCIWDGKPAPSGTAMLKSIENRAPPPEGIASRTDESLPRLRSGLRELKNAGLIEEVEGKHGLSSRGAKVVG